MLNSQNLFFFLLAEINGLATGSVKKHNIGVLKKSVGYIKLNVGQIPCYKIDTTKKISVLL